MTTAATQTSPRAQRPHNTALRGASDRGIRLTPAQRDQYAREYMPLARRIADRMTTRDEDGDEIVGDAMLGLTKALFAFDPTCGAPFATFARHRIRGEILDGKRKRDHLSRDMRRHATAWSTAHDGLQAPCYSSPASLDEILALEEDGRERDSATIQVAAPGIDLSEIACQDELANRVHDALALLPARLRLVLLMRHWEDSTQPEIGEVLGVTASRVCQLESNAELKLAGLLADAH